MKSIALTIATLLIFSMIPGVNYGQNKVVVVPLKSQCKCQISDELKNYLCYLNNTGFKPPAELNCPPKFVFVSSIQYLGNLGGVTGADYKCNALAHNANLPGVYMAWIADATHNPANRFKKTGVPYVTVDNVVVADGW
ncbi:MAG: hypothetical protein V2I36_08550, partial [Desulfopila sp.]|nr:hypothetical protein [Desulfopila sp.]